MTFNTRIGTPKGLCSACTFYPQATPPLVSGVCELKPQYGLVQGSSRACFRGVRRKAITERQA